MRKLALLLFTGLFRNGITNPFWSVQMNVSLFTALFATWILAGSAAPPIHYVQSVDFNADGTGASTRLEEADVTNINAVTAFGWTLSANATAADARTDLELGTMATQASSSYLPLTGGTLTGKLTVDADGIEFQETQAETTPGILRVHSYGVDPGYESLIWGRNVQDSGGAIFNNQACIMLGGNTVSRGGGSIAIGKDADSGGIAIGGGAKANGNGSITIGNQAGTSVNAMLNVIVGPFAGTGITVGTSQQHTFLGAYTGKRNTTGISNTAVGAYAGQWLTTGSGNVLIGDDAGGRSEDSTGLTTGDRNTAIGGNAGLTNPSGGGDTGIEQTGSSNTAVGNSADWGASPASFRTVLGADAIATADNQIMLGRTSDHVMIPGTLVFEGATNDGFETTIQATDPTADRTITLPDASGTVALSTSLRTVSNHTSNYNANVPNTVYTNYGAGSNSVTFTLEADLIVGSVLTFTREDIGAVDFYDEEVTVHIRGRGFRGDICSLDSQYSSVMLI